MGQGGSKNKCVDDGCGWSSPNINYIRVNCGETSVSQIKYWVKECGFPQTGSFSLRQLEQLRQNLEEKEKDRKEKVKPDWKAFGLWMEEAHRRDKKSQAGTEKNSLVSQCLKLPDPTLDCAPQRRRRQPLQAPDVPNAPQPEQEGAVGGAVQDDSDTEPPPPYPKKKIPTAKKRGIYPDLSKLPEPEPDTEIKSKTRTGLTYNVGTVVPSMPMVEVSGLEGTILVHRPWTTQDIKEAMTHLPSPSDGGPIFAAELLTFCREFRPTTSELRRLLLIKMGTGWGKVSAGWPEGDERMTTTDWDHFDNLAFRGCITGLCNRIREQFPVRMDMTKISRCKQEKGEFVCQYLARLTTVHNVHSGLTPPADLNGNGVDAWEAHLQNCFLQGMEEEIADLLKRTCIAWDTGKLSLVERHAIHAEKTLRDDEKKIMEKHTRKMEKATLTLYQGQFRGRGRNQRRGRGQGRMGRNDRYDPEICFNCGKKGQWAKDCREKGKGEEKSD